jgi:hypothetical protein
VTAAVQLSAFETGSPGALAVARYSAVLVDTLTDAVAAVDLPLTRLRYRLALNDTGTADGVLDVRAMAAAGLAPAEATEPVRRTCYLYRDAQPIFGGQVTASDYDDGTETVVLGLSDWFWVLDRRVIMPDPATLPPANVAERVVAFVGVDQCAIVRELVRLAQIGDARDLKLVCSTGNSGVLRDRTYYGYELRNTGTSLRQLADVIDGCDVRMGVTYREGQATPERTVLIGTPLLGSTASGLVWEAGSNVYGYGYPRDASEHADRTYSVGDGAETGTPIVVRDRAADLGEDTAGWPALDAVDSYSSVTDPETLREHGDDQLGRRRGSRVVLGVSAAGALDPVVGSFEIGQYARFVAANRFHDVDVNTRIVGLDVEITEEAGEVVKPLLMPVKG